MDKELTNIDETAKTCRHTTLFGMGIKPEFCRWHANFVQYHSELFPWPCSEKCVLENYRQGNNLDDLPLDETITIAAAKKQIGEELWGMMKFSPKDVALILGKGKQNRNSSPVDLQAETDSSTEAEPAHKSVDRNSRLFQLVAKTVLCATAGLDYEIDYSEDLYDLLESSQVEDNIEIMVMASLYINFLHYQAIKKIDFKETPLKDRLDLLAQLNGEFNKSCKVLESYRKKEWP